jgi:hypothetical protein
MAVTLAIAVLALPGMCQADEQAAAPAETNDIRREWQPVTFRLERVPAARVARKLMVLFGPDRGVAIVFDTPSNSLVVRASADKVRWIAAFLRWYDEPEDGITYVLQVKRANPVFARSVLKGIFTTLEVLGDDRPLHILDGAELILVRGVGSKANLAREIVRWIDTPSK